MNTELDDFTQGYITAALWSCTGNDHPESGGTPLDQLGYKLANIPEDELAKIKADCERFQRENAELLKEAYDLYAVPIEETPEAYAGHDFLMTRNHHGCGFFDRDLGEVGDKLTEACEAWREICLSETGDGKTLCYE